MMMQRNNKPFQKKKEEEEEFHQPAKNYWHEIQLLIILENTFLLKW